VKGQLTLEAMNERLKSARVGVTIRQKGNRLYLYATLPPNPDSTRTVAHQQDVSLKIYANPVGLEWAETEAICRLSHCPQKRLNPTDSHTTTLNTYTA
jgi:hypothetical protein